MNDKWGSNQWVDQQFYTIQPIADTITANWYKSGGAVAGHNSEKGMINPIFLNQGVRRLTPLECERLQGFPDHYTRIPYRGKPPERCPDGPRYRAIGNAMPEPVIRWIGTRIQQVNTILSPSN